MFMPFSGLLDRPTYLGTAFRCLLCLLLAPALPVEAPARGWWPRRVSDNQCSLQFFYLATYVQGDFNLLVFHLFVLNFHSFHPMNYPMTMMQLQTTPNILFPLRFSPRFEIQK